jgi:hypothetical protein
VLPCCESTGAGEQGSENASAGTVEPYHEQNSTTTQHYRSLWKDGQGKYGADQSSYKQNAKHAEWFPMGLLENPNSYV